MSIARPSFEAAPESRDEEGRNGRTETEFSRTLGALLDGMSQALGVPLALLSKGTGSWRFEAESIPLRRSSDLIRSVEDWTGVLTHSLQQRQWMLMVPGPADRWEQTPGLDDLVESFRRSLEKAVHRDDERRLDHLHRRLYAFVLRLGRASTLARTHACILRTLAIEVGARTGALAVFSTAEQALTITETIGYPRAIVDHVRITAGEGVIGQTFESGRASIGDAQVDPRRLRYRTDSYIAVPLRASGQTIAVVTLTDRAGDTAFSDQDLAAVRLLAAPAALALAKLRLNESLDELTRAATVDPVTGLFNRRYFETRLQAEVQRARRQRQDLALLMVDIDDFKRINDTYGHLEGDRALRDVADLLRRGVRIFDVCARYGGEEFAIVMPGATSEMAAQIAERIRQGIYERSRTSSAPMTVSIGVGFLGPNHTQEDLIGAADRALIAAKRAGKNVVKTT